MAMLMRPLVVSGNPPPFRIRVRRIERDVDDACPVGHELHQLPGRASIFGLIESAFWVGAPRRTQRGDVDDVRVRRMNDDAADGLGLLEAHRLPGQAAVRRLVDAAPWRDRVARVRLAGAGPDLHRVARCDREHAHRDDALVVEDRSPGDAIVDGLPDAARGSRGKERLRRRRDAGDVGDPAHGVRRPDVPPPKAGDGL